VDRRNRLAGKSDLPCSLDCSRLQRLSSFLPCFLSYAGHTFWQRGSNADSRSLSWRHVDNNSVPPPDRHLFAGVLEWRPVLGIALVLHSNGKPPSPSWHFLASVLDRRPPLEIVLAMTFENGPLPITYASCQSSTLLMSIVRCVATGHLTGRAQRAFSLSVLVRICRNLPLRRFATPLLAPIFATLSWLKMLLGCLNYVGRAVA
jgi:hypothetical protein